MKKVLITGASGMLGSDFIRTFRSKSEYEVFGLGRTSKPELEENQFLTDITKPIAPHTIGIIPDVIIHTAALTDLNRCEEAPDLAHRVNVDGSRHVAALAGRNTLFFYISTDSVFDGEKGDYSEKDKPNPRNAYAKSKLDGERAVLETNKGFTSIIRTNIYGLNIPMKNSLAEWAYREWQSGKVISGFSDIVFNAVFTGQLVDVIAYLIDRDLKIPILNVGSDEALSKYNFLERFRKVLRAEANLLKEARSTDFPSRVPRPKNTSLNTTLLSALYKVPDFNSGIMQWMASASNIG